MARLENVILGVHRLENGRAFRPKGRSRPLDNKGAENACKQNPHCDNCHGHRPARVRFAYGPGPPGEALPSGWPGSGAGQLGQLDPWRGAGA